MALDAFLETAKQIVHEAGQIAGREFGASRIVRTKQYSDIVTEGDLRVEEHVLSKLRQSYPDHGFVSEEAGEHCRDAEYVWILDPIDGTKYYARGIPLYSISLALKRRRELILGVVLIPETGQMFCGAAGSGAELNGRPIRCSRAAGLEQSTVCLEIPSRDSPPQQRTWAIGKMAVLVDCVQRVRILGVAPFGLCFCAAGGFDAYVNLGSAPKEHDIAAGQVILTAAGGRFCRLGQRIVAGPSGLCGQLVDLLGLQDEAPDRD
jgi:myo-inositol-1(or 4)-monophosphatase